MNDKIIQLLLLYKTLNSKYFAILKHTPSGYIYVQPGISIRLPDIGVPISTGVLLVEDLHKNLEIISDLIEYKDKGNIIYTYPDKDGILFTVGKLGTNEEEYKNKIKLVTSRGIYCKISLLITKLILIIKGKKDIAKLL